jgi:hypothetical protein
MVPISPVSPSKRKDELPLTRFKVERSAYSMRALPQTFTVETEYQRYMSAELSSAETGILHFWEVSSSLELQYSTAHS